MIRYRRIKSSSLLKRRLSQNSEIETRIINDPIIRFRQRVRCFLSYGENVDFEGALQCFCK